MEDACAAQTSNHFGFCPHRAVLYVSRDTDKQISADLDALLLEWFLLDAHNVCYHELPHQRESFLQEQLIELSEPETRPRSQRGSWRWELDQAGERDFKPCFPSICTGNVKSLVNKAYKFGALMRAWQRYRMQYSGLQDLCLAFRFTVNRAVKVEGLCVC